MTKRLPRSLGVLRAGEVVDRARSAVGHGTKYVLGAGGRNPRAQRPGTECDCSGFVAWALGVDRYLPNGLIPHLPGGDWFETSAVYLDARSPLGYVVEVPWAAAAAGDVVVWPDRNGSQGHIGVVTQVSTSGPQLVAHCSSGNWRTTADAIRETSSVLFLRNGAIVARVAWVVP